MINIKLENLESIDKKRDIADREYIVALKDDIKKTGVPIPNYTAAAVIGLSLAALRVAKEEKTQMEEYKTLRGKMLKIIRSIYARYEVIADEENFTVDDLDFMVTGGSATKMYYTVLYALPPAVKMAIQSINEYHEKMQLVLQAA